MIERGGNHLQMRGGTELPVPTGRVYEKGKGGGHYLPPTNSIKETNFIQLLEREEDPIPAI